MSVVCRSWEVASGPTVGFDRAPLRSNVCAATPDVLSSETPNCCSSTALSHDVGFDRAAIHSNLCAATPDVVSSETPDCCSSTALSHDSLVNAVVAGTDVAKGLIFPNQKALSPQDTVTRGLSSLSLLPQSQHPAENPTEDCKISPSYESNNESLKLKCSIPFSSKGTNFFCVAACSAECNTHERVSGMRKSIHSDGSHSKGFEGSSRMQGSMGPNSLWVATRNSAPHHDNYREFEFNNFPRRALEVVVEDKPFQENFAGEGSHDPEVDVSSASSTSSVSSFVDSPVDGSVSMWKDSHGVEESGALSAFKGLSTFGEGSSSGRKGLSQFYAGKSRSFSCLGDALSMKDLAKPENPYANKRRCLTSSVLGTGRSQLPPLQKRSASISTKGLHSENSNVALAVTTSSAENGLVREGKYESLEEAQSCWQKRPLTSRSFSLSDLQRMSPC